MSTPPCNENPPARAGLCPGGQPRVLDVALDQATALQHLADA
jgi:hypothetical protein